jgi:glycosyltransferase involved in cell wall biosynthesis
MKILHLSYADIIGGANKAAYNIHNSLLEFGIDSKMLVMEKHSDDDSVIGIKDLSPLKYYNNKLKQILARAILKLQKSSNQTLHSINIFPSGIHKIINKMDIDIINLHWINSEMISIKEIGKIKKPIFWTLADMWPYCGSEHYAQENIPNRYKDGYQSDNRPKNHHWFDLDKFTWRRKIFFWKNKKINIIATSRWNARCARSSILFNESKINIVPQSVDLNVFKPLDKKISREICNLPQKNSLILFAAPDPKKDMRKGYSLLKESLKIISKNNINNKLELIVLGSSSGNIEKEFGIKTYYINFLYDNISRALLYNSADILLAPSIQENLSNIVMEALASSLPSVAFNIGGMPDLIDHNINGYLAKPFDCKDYAKGILSILQSNQSLEMFSMKAREKAEKCYATKVVASEYHSIYKERMFK